MKMNTELKKALLDSQTFLDNYLVLFYPEDNEEFLPGLKKSLGISSSAESKNFTDPTKELANKLTDTWATWQNEHKKDHLAVLNKHVDVNQFVRECIDKLVKIKVSAGHLDIGIPLTTIFVGGQVTALYDYMNVFKQYIAVAGPSFKDEEKTYQNLLDELKKFQQHLKNPPSLAESKDPSVKSIKP